MTTQATGTFKVQLQPQQPDDPAGSALLGRLSITKEFQGDLIATSQGTMLSAGTTVADSAGYVALEQVSGTLQGRTGTFVLQHNGSMARGVPQLTITVVPDSGTAELLGLAGTMAIRITEGQHFYDFDYTLTATP